MTSFTYTMYDMHPFSSFQPVAAQRLATNACGAKRPLPHANVLITGHRWEYWEYVVSHSSDLHVC